MSALHSDTDRWRVIAEALAEASRVHQRLLELDPAPMLAAVGALEAVVAGGGKVLAFGNGGSAADAQHFAAELVGRFTTERRPLAAVALAADVSVLTGVANDFGYEQVFARQLRALGRVGDVALAISTSGASPNVLAAVEAAGELGITSIAMTGRGGGALGQVADVHVNVPHDSVARVQEAHRTLLHAMCELIERGLEASQP